jgi:hypothetical protein
MRADVFSTRWVISSNRPNDGTGMYRLDAARQGESDTTNAGTRRCRLDVAEQERSVTAEA